MPDAVMLAAPMSALAPTVERALALVRDNVRWVAELKLDGIRCMARRAGGTAQLTNRRGEDITHRYPDVVSQLLDEAPDDLTLDGEIVTMIDGRIDFSGAHRRDAQENPRKIASLAVSLPATFIAFDVLTLAGVSVRTQANSTRRLILEQDCGRVPLVPRTDDIVGLWQIVMARNIEGVVVKDVNAPYTASRSRNWVKIKRTHRASVLVMDADAGEGRRAETFGALNMQLLDPAEGVVDVGRVGSGFTEADVRDVAVALADVTRLPLIVEVEFLEVSHTGQLRMPVFRGVRNDVDPRACTTAQLPSRRPT